MATKKRSVKRAHNSDDVILAAYFGGKVSARTLASAIRRLDIEGEAFEGGSITLLDAAVAAVLLKSTRAELPQWAVVDKGVVRTSGRPNRQSVRSAYKPKHLFRHSTGQILVLGSRGRRPTMRPQSRRSRRWS